MGREGIYKSKKCVVLTSLIAGKDGPVTLPPSFSSRKNGGNGPH